MSTIAGSMITVAGVVFSITIVTLSLTSQQFGPRLLRNFLHDAPTQAVFGCFIGTFLYCLLVLRAIRAEHESIHAFVPNIAVALGVMFGVASIFVLVFFIHHTANAIRAPTLAWRTSQQMMIALARLYPVDQEGSDDSTLRTSIGAVSAEVHACSSGYVQGIDREALQAMENSSNLSLEVVAVPGSFVALGDVVALARGGMLDAEQERKAAAAFTTGSERTLNQDPQFGFAMLTEMAIRSVSPSMNDPYTAIQCIDRIREALTFVAGRGQPPLRRWPMPTFVDLLGECWTQLLYYSRDNPPVINHLRISLEALKGSVRKSADRDAVDRWLARMNNLNSPA